jgi:CHRD domain/PEP-CTERM motif
MNPVFRPLDLVSDYQRIDRFRSPAKNWTMKPRLFLLAAAAAVAASPSSRAVTTLIANMTNAGENPPTVPTLTGGQPRPASFGTATFVLNDAQTAMTMVATVNNIDFTGSQTGDTNDNLTNAHIHASPTVTATTNAGVVWGFIGSPLNDTNPADVVVTPFAQGVGGTVTAKWDAPEGNGTTLTAQLGNILTTHSYINFHTAQFGGGEIRGFIVVVPEPATVGLLGLGMLSAFGISRRRRLNAA